MITAPDPAASAAPPVPAPAAPAAPPTLPTMLVVDDEEGPRLSLRMVFKNDFRVHAVENGEKAIEFARHNPIHVAILDIRMAGRSGIEVLRSLKEIDPHVEIIMLTAYETIETARQALRLGACDYLSKPFDLPTIREAVARALRLRRISETVLATQERLHRLTDQLHDATLKEDMARTTNQIYAGVLHDINNPLTIIVGYVEMLELRLTKVSFLHGADLDAVREDLAIISKQVNTCFAIATRYLRSLGKRHFSNREVRVNQVLTDLQTLLKHHPAIKGGHLGVKLLDKDAAALINGTELIQILLNLTINAFQSTSKDQTVWVTAEVVNQPLPVETLCDGPQDIVLGREPLANEPPLIALSVLDQGPGIAPEVLPHIFEPYFTTKADQGTGLGLAIVSRLVQDHRGLLHARTKLGAGTRMTVYFPAKEPSASNEPFRI
ncbi:MAG: response regulator [Opitutaceae bacterium]|nr:response regulator [Opitutaceae bacterium]